MHKHAGQTINVFLRVSHAVCQLPEFGKVWYKRYDLMTYIKQNI